jgi:hypothetical protein
MTATQGLTLTSRRPNDRLIPLADGHDEALGLCLSGNELEIAGHLLREA